MSSIEVRGSIGVAKAANELRPGQRREAFRSFLSSIGVSKAANEPLKRGVGSTRAVALLIYLYIYIYMYIYIYVYIYICIYIHMYRIEYRVI